MGSGNYVAAAVGGLIIAVLVLIIALVASSLKKLDSAEVALKYDTYQKTLYTAPYYEGLHSGPPGYEFIVFPSVFQTLDYRSLGCLNKDGVKIWLSVGFQYRVRHANLHVIVMQFKDVDGYNDILRKTGASAIHDSCSQFNTSQFQSERGAFQGDLTRRLVDKFERLKCEITDLQVNDIRRPHRYESTIQDKEAAREDIEVARQERPRLRTAATTKKIEAATGAQIIVNEANTEARIVLTAAESEASGILNDYHQEAATYRSVMDSNSLDTEGFLAYMGVRAISSSKNPVNVGMKAPAKTSFMP